MKYYLMHRDDKAAVLEINTEYGAIEKIKTMYLVFIFLWYHQREVCYGTDEETERHSRWKGR